VKKNTGSLENVIPLELCASLIDWEEQFGRPGPMNVEIGFGMGEHLLASAGQHPEQNYIGIEQDRKRLLKTTRLIARIRGTKGLTLSNVRLLGVDAWVAFERLIPAKKIEKIDCLFPCPWPKKKHVRFRLFSREFLKLINSRLRARGTVQVVTDFYPYVEWVTAQTAQTGFDHAVRKIQPRFNTKFEKKWKDQGQQEFFEICFRKKQHCPYPVTKETVLKSYKIKEFDPDRFVFKDKTGAISIVGKDTLYDPQKQHLMVRMVVAEGHLTQHFWVSIAKRPDGWRIYRAVGQNVLQTPGLTQAMEAVCAAACASAK
jgi:tRNA (guanine-N7-)-methyltransferase